MGAGDRGICLICGEDTFEEEFGFCYASLQKFEQTRNNDDMHEFIDEKRNKEIIRKYIALPEELQTPPHGFEKYMKK